MERIFVGGGIKSRSIAAQELIYFIVVLKTKALFACCALAEAQTCDHS